MYITVEPLKDASKVTYSNPMIKWLLDMIVSTADDAVRWCSDEINRDWTIKDAETNGIRIWFRNGQYSKWTDTFLLLNVPDDSPLARAVEDRSEFPGDIDLNELIEWYYENNQDAMPIKEFPVALTREQKQFVHMGNSLHISDRTYYYFPFYIRKDADGNYTVCHYSKNPAELEDMLGQIRQSI